MTPPLNVNRSRTCKCCKKVRFRVLVLSPTKDDPDYTVAVCPTCDMTLGNEKRLR